MSFVMTDEFSVRFAKITVSGLASHELAEQVAFRYSRERSIRFSDILHDFSVTIPRCHRHVYMSTVSFPAQLNSGSLCL